MSTANSAPRYLSGSCGSARFVAIARISVHSPGGLFGDIHGYASILGHGVVLQPFCFSSARRCVRVSSQCDCAARLHHPSPMAAAPVIVEVPPPVLAQPQPAAESAIVAPPSPRTPRAPSSSSFSPAVIADSSNHSRTQWIVGRIPEHKKTGNYQTDINNTDNRHAVRSLLTMLLDDDSLAPGLLAEAQRRRIAMNGVSDERDVFVHSTTLGKLDEDWLISWLTQRSDLTNDDIISMKKRDTEAAQQLLQYELQLPLTLKMNQFSKDKAVAKRVFDARANEMGRRLQRFRAADMAAGAASWKDKCFQFNWTSDTFDAKVTHVHHWNGDVAEVPEHCIITRQHTLQFNWSDWSAQVARSPLPPLKLCDFFKAKRNGPWSYALPPKPKEFEKTLRGCRRRGAVVARAAEAAGECSRVSGRKVAGAQHREEGEGARHSSREGAAVHDRGQASPNIENGCLT